MQAKPKIILLFFLKKLKITKIMKQLIKIIDHVQTAKCF
jgi:hypothetical protein